MCPPWWNVRRSEEPEKNKDLKVVKKKKKVEQRGWNRPQQSRSFKSRALTSSFQIWKVTLKSYGCPELEHSFHVDVHSGLTTLVTGSRQEPEKLLGQICSWWATPSQHLSINYLLIHLYVSRRATSRLISAKVASNLHDNNPGCNRAKNIYSRWLCCCHVRHSVLAQSGLCT